ncbi:TIR domain-containing protein [Pseudomonas sp.]|uniref:TIR domain-containing protein n=1 Tax=Pseudomonas sp. TaxID=306 RepID=UPI0027368AD6|nr:TIR domain-containing protein [Pseudomonas sp.]MDP2746695.1 TIR domain-containing protein [Pseudomonas sp.]
MSIRKNIFLSYSWSDMEIADQIEKDLTALQLNITRDVRDLEYKSSISGFMESIREADFAVILISDGYLRSKNCMREVLHLLKDRDYENKILPVIVRGTSIYSVADRLAYTRHWLQEQEKIKYLIDALPPTSIISELNELRSVESIASCINEFLAYISDRKNLTFDELKKESYASIITCLGGLNITHLVGLLRISFIEDIDEKEIALDQWLEENEPISDAYSIRAGIASRRGNIKKAEINYEKSLELNGDNAYALNNYGYMLYCRKTQLEKARGLFERAVSIMPNLTEARLNLGVLLTNYFDDYEGAKEQYETIISYNPAESKAYANLTNYYKSYKKDSKESREKICELYEKALVLNPDYLEAHFAYGSYCSELLGEHNKAISHYDEMIRIDPESAELVTALKQRVQLVIERNCAKKQSRNDLCACGSGKKYKKCHGA